MTASSESLHRLHEQQRIAIVWIGCRRLRLAPCETGAHTERPRSNPRESETIAAPRDDVLPGTRNRIDVHPPPARVIEHARCPFGKKRVAQLRGRHSTFGN